LRGARPKRVAAAAGVATGNYPQVFERIEERNELRQRLSQRKSFLFHGPAGVGKTLLLSAVLPEFPDILYSAGNATPQALYRNLAESLVALRHSVFAESGADLHTKSAVALKGLLRDALSNSRYLIVLDHLMRPSQSLATALRELMVNWSIPVIAVTRSAHMEDAGFILPLFADRADKLALRNFDTDTAQAFATSIARKEGLTADNLPQFIGKVVEYSEGNPGAILRMIRMARQTKYLHQDQIKIAPLYIDYKIATVSE